MGTEPEFKSLELPAPCAPSRGLYIWVGWNNGRGNHTAHSWPRLGSRSERKLRSKDGRQLGVPRQGSRMRGGGELRPPRPQPEVLRKQKRAL